MCYGPIDFTSISTLWFCTVNSRCLCFIVAERNIEPTFVDWLGARQHTSLWCCMSFVAIEDKKINLKLKNSKSKLKIVAINWRCKKWKLKWKHWTFLSCYGRLLAEKIGCQDILFKLYSYGAMTCAFYWPKFLVTYIHHYSRWPPPFYHHKS